MRNAPVAPRTRARFAAVLVALFVLAACGGDAAPIAQSGIPRTTTTTIAEEPADDDAGDAGDEDADDGEAGDGEAGDGEAGDGAGQDRDGADGDDDASTGSDTDADDDADADGPSTGADDADDADDVAADEDDSAAVAGELLVEDMDIELAYDDESVAITVVAPDGTAVAVADASAAAREAVGTSLVYRRLPNPSGDGAIMLVVEPGDILTLPSASGIESDTDEVCVEVLAVALSGEGTGDEITVDAEPGDGLLCAALLPPDER